ncbi:MAG: hypothetical protein IPP61_02780 [Cytophagaceae bacterium]|nr:hypothetical protein [Cytophagaceae bacterium]MBK9934842.1 hypothetical protein [Cytophagaceae bacterium]MBL0301280.1 hypothetical protein [Cytophagaceae bacterium]MBL0324097.1 hypothetical protein [Cytophagaceae bacterium]
MKTSNYIFFLAIYGGITGAMMLLDGKGSLETYGVSADPYHVVIMEYLGISNLAMAALIFFVRNEVSLKVLRIILIISAIEMIGSSLKGFYDVQISGVPGNTFFWVDAIIRFLVGLISIFITLRISKETF